MVAAVAGPGLLAGHPANDQTASPPAAATGPLREAGNASCAEDSQAAVAKRAFAFDGTVTAVGPARTNRPDARLDLVAATFKVNTWYAGGSGESVTVDITPPDAGSIDETPPAYVAGTRLLVSGEPRWGGAPLTDAIAWGCGFTRYYDHATADS